MLGQILELYSRCGESLIDNGLKEAVLPISEAYFACDLFMQNHLIVLGGDLYAKNSSGGFDCFYADWFYSGVSSIDSIQEARTYLAQFEDKRLYVSFVLKIP